MALNLTRIGAQVTNRRGSGPGKEAFMRLQEGPNFIRIFKIQHTVVQRDFDTRLYLKGDRSAPKVGSLSEELSRPYIVHLRSGMDPFNCFLNKSNCEICQEASHLMSSANKGDITVGRKMRSQERHILQVVNMSDPSKGIQILELGPGAFRGVWENMKSKLDDGITEDSLFGANGRDFKIVSNPNAAMPQDFYKVSLRDKEQCAVLNVTGYKYLDPYTMTNFDPADSPPVDAPAVASAPQPPVEAPPAAAPAPAPAPAASGKRKLLSKDDLKPAAPAKPDYKVGDEASWMDEGKVYVGKVIKVSGTVLNVEDARGIWELDISELIPF